MTKNGKEITGLFQVFEEAYCLYRLNETAKALEVINKVKVPDVKHKELKAQILYRLEKFEDSYSVYRDILKNTSDDEFEVVHLATFQIGDTASLLG